MSAAKKIVNKKILRELVPLNALSQERFEEILGKIVIQEVLADHHLFRIDERDNQVVFLLGGEVSLSDRNGEPAGTIIAGSDQGLRPIADGQPRPLSARAVKKSVVARIDAGLLDAFLTWDQSNDAEAVAIGADENEDWMTRMLQSQAFEKIPPASIQKLLLKMEAIRLAAGATVIRQGDQGDYFYTIENGRCAVTRRETPQSEERLLAELSGGDCFGEEALVSSVERNATVSMLTDGVLMRLAKKDFVELLQGPLIRYVDYEKASVMIDDGAIWVDVRSAEEYDSSALEDSVNIPLAAVRGEMPELIFNVSYIICCENGKLSESAAFLFSHKGFDVYVLRGGLKAIPESSPAGAVDKLLQTPAAAHQSLADGDHGETAADRTETETPAGTGGDRQKISKLQAEKLRLESDLAKALEQKTLIERVVGEQKMLHDLDKMQIAQAGDEHKRQMEALQDEIRQLESRMVEKTKEIDSILSDKQAATEALDSQTQEWIRERNFFKSENKESQRRIADLQKQIEQAREKDSSETSGIRNEMEALLEKTNKRIENKEFQCIELKQSMSRLQGELKLVQQERKTLQQELDAANDDSAGKQREIDAIKEQLASVASSSDEQMQALQLQLETMRLQHENSKRHAADAQAQFNQIQDELVSLKAVAASHEQNRKTAEDVLQSKIQQMGGERTSLISANEEAQQHIADLRARIEHSAKLHADEKSAMQNKLDERVSKIDEEIDNGKSRCAELEQGRSDLQAELEAVRKERDSLQQTLAGEEKNKASQQQRIEGLEVQVADLSGDGEKMQQVRLELGDALEQMASMKADRTRLEQEALLLGQQKEELQKVLEQHEERESTVRHEHEQLLMKANDDLSHKKDIEQELQGQIDRLRKKLEQTTAELKSVREAERSDIESIRDELHAERSARAAERAEMAARQRELKEQLAAVASEHEENLAIHGDAIEQARLQQMHETRQQTEAQLEQLLQELKLAHDQIADLEKSENTSVEDGHGLSGKQQQYESSLEKLRIQAEQLMQERDSALKEQHALLEKVEGLHAGAGEMPAADVAALQHQLDEALKNAEVAERLRAEAETASARMRDERDTLQKQVSNNMSLGNAVNLPSVGDKQEQPVKPVFTAKPVNAQPVAATWKSRTTVSGQSFRNTSGAVKRKLPLLAMVIGLVVIIGAGLAYGLKPLISKPDRHVAQAQGETNHPASTQPQVGGVYDSTHVAEHRESVPGEGSKPLIGPAAPAVQAEVKPEFLPVVTVTRPQGQDPDSAMPLPVTPYTELAEAAMESVPERRRLQAAGAFRDNLKDGGVAPSMVKLPAASYMMGSNGNLNVIDESPQHEIHLTRFAVSKYEVTFADYDRFARASGIRLPHDKTWGRESQPAINVSWVDAQAYVQWLSAQTGHSYRLPTEAQWEFAARADSVEQYPWDSAPEIVPANCFDCGSEWDQARTAPVGSFPPNGFGLHDMGGNVQEWTEDCYSTGYEGAPGDGSARHISGCTQRVVRGGAYTSPINSLRTTSRGQFDQDTRLDNIGFRVVRKY